MQSRLGLNLQWSDSAWLKSNTQNPESRKQGKKSWKGRIIIRVTIAGNAKVHPLHTYCALRLPFFSFSLIISITSVFSSSVYRSNFQYYNCDFAIGRRISNKNSSRTLYKLSFQHGYSSINVFYIIVYFFIPII